MFLLFYTICLSSWQKKEFQRLCALNPNQGSTPPWMHCKAYSTSRPTPASWKLFQNCLYKSLNASEKFKVHNEATLFFDWRELQFFPNLRYNIYTYMYIYIMYYIYICIYNIYICMYIYTYIYNKFITPTPP